MLSVKTMYHYTRLDNIVKINKQQLLSLNQSVCMILC